MRLIDADALIKAIIRKEPFSDCARVVIAECIEEVRHAKTVEPERKKGKWILVTDSNGQHCICDHCGEWKYHQGQKFCGECGVDMREEGEQE